MAQWELVKASLTRKCAARGDPLPAFQDVPLWDAHAWCVDSRGCIYDYVQPSWHAIAALRGCSIRLPVGAVTGVTPAELLSFGLQYIAAPADAQAAILGSVAPFVAAEQLRLAATGEANPGLCTACFAVPPSMQPLLVCDVCRLARYCSRECQAAHWTAAHKLFCVGAAERGRQVQLNMSG